MIDKIIGLSVRWRGLILILTGLWVIGGLLALKELKLGSVPDITNNQVQVISIAPQLSALDMEQLITYPIEREMGNLPGVVELRSVSRPGLSVVTVVFEDEMGTYLPRQLVQEKLTVLKDELPDILEKGPFAGPITTGLGEIYQYYLHVDPAYRNVYTLMDLRTIQDWIIRRQMMMVPGVVEVNSLGGFIKQYEVVIDPVRLQRLNIDLGTIIEALEQNNSNSGGAYIEKSNSVMFIRGEGLVRSLEDIANTVVLVTDEGPVRIKDIADTVRWAGAIRYGAMTEDGREVVGGQVLMLKDANAMEVVEKVRERMAEIQKSLPPGITIRPYLDRRDLIERTTETITENLTLGALTVIFVLVFLIGSIRSGLIVASVIPLSLLFAFMLMNLTGITANLMSLGAIDFGIVVDGAVIIVEGMIFALEKKLKSVRNRVLKISDEERKQLATSTASRMMRVALFGQLVVLLVFLPILTLEGVEGRMFKPMAYVFMYVLLGVILLCLTYVPAISSLLVKLPEEGGPMANIEALFTRISRKIMDWLKKAYIPSRDWALNHRFIVLGIALALFGLSIFTFTRMGAVFMPRLNEGDIALQAIFVPGTPLSEVIKGTERLEKIILDSFPEVITTGCRIGVSEIPTDPMPMDFADCHVILEKDRSKWVSASTQEELANKMKEVLERNLPGIGYAFTQPIELRFNELISGVRYDVSIEVYGEDVDVLRSLAEQIVLLIQGVEGAADIAMEPVQKQPQIVVRYKRERLARYGITIEEANRHLQAAFAGYVVGTAYEQEKRFDIVVRYSPEYRKDLEHVKQIRIKTNTGALVPFSEIADIKIEYHPAQISRENGYRRVYVGVNVRNRDVESVVEDIQKRLEALPIPPGYWITYGGTFENLQRARARLAIVVPIVLLVIFVLVYMALGNLKDTLLIYTAVPLATIGGVYLLAIRGMPFSISAGVGFVVLFGVAVLNGMLLLARANALRKENVPMLERIKIASAERLRPILLTALTTIVGFTPMAFSQSAGAEVQRPLATVVIGGLITATFLSLIVIPVLYTLAYRKEKSSQQ